MGWTLVPGVVASRKACKPDLYPEHARLLVEDFPERGYPVPDLDKLVQVAESVLRREAERSGVELTSVCAVIKAAQDSYLESPRAKGPDPIDAVAWYRDRHYIDDPALWRNPPSGGPKG
jgi:hypothetical protein